MLGTLSFILLAAAASGTPCESLRSLTIAQTTVTTADVIQAGPFVQPGTGRGPGARGPVSALAPWVAEDAVRRLLPRSLNTAA
jgi:hypothetical protein